MNSEGRSDFDNLQAGDIVDNGGAQSPPAVRGLPTCTSCDGEPTIRVCDNLPAVPAISDAELDAIERYMGDILDMVLGDTVSLPISDRDNRLS